MANQPVKFRKGVSTSLPKTPTNETVGAFLLETDTGNLYVDESSTSRVQIKDSTKADKKHTHTIEDLPFTLKNNTTAGNLNWKDKTTDSTLIPTTNTIAYWNGAFSDSGLSNIEYVKVGPLGTAATLSKSSVINNVSIKDNTLTFTKANNTDTTTVTLPMLKGATTSDDGSLGFVPAPTKSDVSKFLKGDGTWTAITIPTIPTSLKNPNAITIKLNDGNTEGTNLFTYDGSAVKSIDITPSSISAATSTHTHGNITNDGKVGTVANKVLTTSTGGAIVASDEGTAFNKNFETSTSSIKSNGTVSVGTSTNVARADHIHPTDTSRASVSALTSHTDDKIVHITDTERTTWNAKQDATPNGTDKLIGEDNKIASVYLPSSNIDIGKEDKAGLTKLYSHEGQNTDGTITQLGLNTIFNNINDDISDNYRELKQYIDDKFSGNNGDDSEDSPTIIFATKEYVDKQDSIYSDKIENYHKELVKADEETNKRIDGINDSLDISDYIRTTEKDNLSEAKLLELGYVDSSYVQKIHSDKIAFYQGDTVMTSIHDNRIETNNINVKNTITLGNEEVGIFEILVDSANGLVIK